MRRNGGSRRTGRRSIGDSSPTCRSNRAKTPSRSSNGMRCGGRSRFLKSGCRAEESRLRTAERLANLISLFCILSWRIFWMTMLNRSASAALPSAALTETEIELLDQLVKDKGRVALRRKTLSHDLTKIARLGGYLARANDPPPGNIVIWRGLSRLTDIGLGAMIGAKIVRN